MDPISPDQILSEPIYDASRTCLALFDAYITDASLSEQSLALVGELRGEFKTWAAYIGVFAVPRASLDARLISHDDIRNMVLDLLMVLEQNLKWARENQLERGQEEGELDDSLGIPAAKSTIERLFILAVSIRRSARQTYDVRHKAHSSGNADASCLLLLKARYPNARKSLLDQLVQSIHARGASLQYLQSHNRKLAHEREPSTKSCEDLMEDGTELSHDLVPAKRIERSPDTELGTDPSLFSPTTVIQQHKLAMRNVKPSRSLISIGSTVKDVEGDVLPYPPMPKSQSRTSRVTCTICSEPIDVSVLTEERWKAHVDVDLHPYICISEQCKEPPKFFRQKQDWVEHMQTRHTLEWAQKIHTETWQCDIEHEPKYFDQKEHYVSHLKDAHDGQFTPSQIQGRARRSKKTATREPFVCPLCDCIPDDIEPIIYEKPYNKFATHIRRHLKYISFFSLSYLGIDFADGESATGSSSDVDEKRVSRSSHSLNYLKDVSLSDIPETEVDSQSCKVQDQVFLNVPLDSEDSDWSFMPQKSLEANWDMLRKGLGSEPPIPELFRDEQQGEPRPPAELCDKQPGKARLQVPDGIPSFQPPTPSDFLAIAIDFGTVFSSVSYALCTAPDSIFDIEDYPNFQSDYNHPTQVPTILDLETGSWGYQVTPSTKSIKWLKLLLLKEDDIQCDEIRAWRIKEAQQLQAQGKTAIEVVAAFLRKIWNHTLNRVKASKAYLEISSLPLRVAITIPLIWPQYAEAAVRQAAQMAGILDRRGVGETILTLVHEPEAAGLHFLLEMQSGDIHLGDSFVVCDAGGSSVDVSGYLIESVEPFRAKECVGRHGKLAGAILMDEKFLRYLSSKPKFKLQELDPSELQTLITKWETDHKRIFHGGAEQVSFTHTAPARAFGTWERLRGKTSFTISCEATTTFFLESYTSIKNLVSQQLESVEEQVGKQPKYIVLFGGLRDSPYIYQKLQASFPRIEVVKSRPGNLAVAHGAVVKLIRDGLSKLGFISLEQQYSLSVLPAIRSIDS